MPSLIKNPPEFLKKWDENMRLLDYVIEKSENMTKPLTVIQFCRNFKFSVCSATSEATLIRKFKTVCYRIHELDDLDNDTKVRIIFMMSVPVNPTFLKELEKDATVVLNKNQQIVEYTAKDGSIKFNAIQAPESPEPEEPDAWIEVMMEWLAKHSKKSCTPMIFPELDKAFRRGTGFMKNTLAAHRLLESVREEIFTTTKYDLKTIVKMLYISMTPVTGSVLEELRKNAIVEVDDRDIIKFYKAYDGSLELPVPPPIVPAPPPEVYAVTSSGRRVRQLAPTREMLSAASTPQMVSTVSTPTRPNVSKRSSSAREQTVSKKKPRRGKRDQQNENIPADDTADEPEEEDEDGKDVPIRVINNSPADLQQEEDHPSNSTAIAGLDDDQADFMDVSPIPDTNTQSTSSSFYAPETAPESLFTPRRNITVKTEVPDDEEVICDTTFVPVKNTGDLSLSASNSTQNMTDSRTYLVKLRGLILSIESPLFDDLKRDFNAKYQLFKNKTHRVPIYNILSMLNSTYMTAMQYSRAPKPDDPKDQFMSLKEFLNSLYIHVVIVECDELGAKIAEAKQNAGDLVVPIDRIRDSLATLIYVATSKL